MICFNVSCVTNTIADNTEYVKVDSCRENWNYSPLKEKTTISLLFLDEKGNVDLVSWSNFFVGINEKGDTIGIIDYKTNKKFKKGEKIIFQPSQKKSLPDGMTSTEQDIPIFTVRKSSQENDIYCAVKEIYYGTIEL